MPFKWHYTEDATATTDRLQVECRACGWTSDRRDTPMDGTQRGDPIGDALFGATVQILHLQECSLAQAMWTE